MRITFNEKCQGGGLIYTAQQKSDYDTVIPNARVQSLINSRYVLKIEIFIYFAIHVSPGPSLPTPPLRSLCDLLNSRCWQPVNPVYGIECARVNFVSRTNGFPLFSQIANVRNVYFDSCERDYPTIVSKCFIDVGDGIYQRVMTNGSASCPESNLT